MSRTSLLCALAAGAILPFAPGSASAAAAAAPRPNVLLICVDDLKPLLGCYGDPRVKTPGIDRLAARGVVFERAFCNQAVCAPSRNALMTGLRPATIGIYDLATNFRKAVPDAVTVAQHFKAHGYRTEAMGKIMHVGHGNHEDAASWTVPHWKPGGGYALPANQEATKQEQARARAAGAPATQPASKAKGASTECADVADNVYGDGQIADEAVRRLQTAAKTPGEPFFMGVGFLKPHLPFCAPKKYWDLYKESDFPLPELRTPPKGAPEFAPTTWGELRAYTDIPRVGDLDDRLTRHLIHGYHAATSFMDAQLARVLDALDATGLAANTIVVLWGDHGWHLGDHGMWCKHTNYEQAARIPLIVAAPGAGRTGVKTGALAETVDLYPTLCELAGLPVPAGLDGRSFVATLKDPAAATKEAVLHVYPRGGGLIGRAVRETRYRLVEWKAPGAPAADAVLELYDYESDPLETRNLAAEKTDVVARLRAILAKFPEAKPPVQDGGEPGGAKAGGKGGRTGGGRSNQDRGAMFDKRDKNRDGRLTREEFLDGQPDPDEAPKRFPTFDTDKSGDLSRDEFIRGGKPGA
ncbi:MAG: iduronate-2-sulfatase [Lentisphaerae bacterium]|nr:iduronate-2-sulfatase [Lentisphaerota bacterium]